MDILSFSSKEARDILSSGYVLALPTETVYGVGVRWDDETAYERLCKAKNRRPSKPIAVMCSDTFDLTPYFAINDGAKRVMKKFLPGPLTCLVKAKESAPKQTHLGTYVAGIRIPAKKELLDFLSSLPTPLQVTSANISGSPALKDFEEVKKTFENVPVVKGIIKGSCQSGTPTTVVDLTGERPVLIRQGDITLEQIEEAFYDKK